MPRQPVKKRSHIVKNAVVRDLMVPLSEYATVSEGSTLFDAVLALEKAQLEFDYKHTQYHHRAVLILDKKKKVVGKLSQFDVLKALEQKSEKAEQIDDIVKFGFSDEFVTSLKKKYRWTSNIPLDAICITAGSRKVEDFMQAPTEGEYIDENAPLNAAVNQIVSGGLFSLLVTKNDAIVGILRLTDVFAAVFHVMKESEQ